MNSILNTLEYTLQMHYKFTCLEIQLKIMYIYMYIESD